MGEYKELAEKVLRVLEKMRAEGEILPEDIMASGISEIIGGHSRGAGGINFYPYGRPGSGCYDFSLYLSLQSPAYINKRRRGHMNCDQAIQKIVQHMQGLCFYKTRVAVLLTDSWSATSFERWRANLEQIRNYALLEIYLLSGRAVSEIYI